MKRRYRALFRHLDRGAKPRAGRPSFGKQALGSFGEFPPLRLAVLASGRDAGWP